jgi:hypothetical protein
LIAQGQPAIQDYAFGDHGPLMGGILLSVSPLSRHGRQVTVDQCNGFVKVD